MNLVEYLGPLDAQLDDNGEPDGIGDEYRHDKDDMYNWRAYRIGLKHSIQLMQTPVDNKVNAKNLLMSYRKSVQVIDKVEIHSAAQIDESVDTDMVVDVSGGENQGDLKVGDQNQMIDAEEVGEIVVQLPKGI